MSVVPTMPGTAAVTRRVHLRRRQRHAALRRRRRLSDVSPAPEAGEILAVIGPNGAGKTSLFNSLDRRLQAAGGNDHFHSSGAATPRGHRAASPPGQQAGIARTFQTIRLFNALTTFENVKIGAEAHQRHRPDRGHAPRAPDTARGARERQEAPRDARLRRPARRSQRHRRARSPTATADGSRSPGRLRPSPECSCSTSRRPAPTRRRSSELTELIRRVSDELGVIVLLIEHDMGLVMSLAERISSSNFGRDDRRGRAREDSRNNQLSSRPTSASGSRGVRLTPAGPAWCVDESPHAAKPIRRARTAPRTPTRRGR